MSAGDDRRDRQHEEEYGPAEESEDGMIGNVDEESSENRREGLEEDRERARDEEDIGGERD